LSEESSSERQVALSDGLRESGRRGGPSAEGTWLALAALAVVLLGASGCSHHQQVAQAPPPQALPPPAQQPVYAPPTEQPQPSVPAARIPPTPAPPGGVTADDLDYIATHRPILTQVGYATWYSAPYKGRRSANGQVFDDDAMTAAHRTLPMGALIVTTNLATGQSAAMRITDRGPFVEGRILDMTMAAAKATGVYRAGLAEVRIDVYETPKSINSGGRWCVQIGAFHSEREAMRLKEQLLRTYADANVIEFAGEDSYWVRIRPEGDDRQMAEYIAQHVRPSEGEAYLTRLD
jgi:rare lipoprotein A